MENSPNPFRSIRLNKQKKNANGNSPLIEKKRLQIIRNSRNLQKFMCQYTLTSPICIPLRKAERENRIQQKTKILEEIPEKKNSPYLK